MPITVGTLGQLRSVEQRKSDIIFSFESSELVLTPLLSNVIRHTWVPTHWRMYASGVTESHAVQRHFWPAGPTPSITETSETVHIRVGDVYIEARRDPFRLRYFSADGQLFLEEAAEGGLSWSYWDYTLRYRFAYEDHFYGLGQVNQLVDHVDLDQRGHQHEIWHQHPPHQQLFSRPC
jgi:hypothetical protein